ncbi:hypothetical protein QN277_001817 [Acacia crassicarpa]|uniref:DUF4283 domain-containing protein n=1 Tax=Acacia crassicarpa TaxID=499986 RepID=A0AAE1N858_9FABA|nr:hypothetical protein QN277_001817 [Acacia crassicarpa]
MEVGQSSVAKTPKQVELDLDETVDSHGGTLVGRVETTKRLNIPTVISMIKKGWHMGDELEIHELDRNKFIFLFRFKKGDDFYRILKGRPWSVLGHLLNLQIWKECMVLEDVDFNWTPFWLQFHGLPIEAFNGPNAIKLGEAVGSPVMYELPKVGGKLTRSFVRVRTLLQLNAPLTAGVWVPRKRNKPAWVSIKYERLQSFCFQCGCIIHEGGGCKEPMFSKDLKVQGEYGSSMCTQAVRTLEDILQVCQEGWPEVCLPEVFSQNGHSKGTATGVLVDNGEETSPGGCWLGLPSINEGDPLSLSSRTDSEMLDDRCDLSGTVGNLDCRSLMLLPPTFGQIHSVKAPSLHLNIH